MVKVTQSKVRSNNANNVPETNKLPLALSENVLTLLCLSAEHGKLVSELVEPNQFDNQVHTIYASQAIAFWKKHKKPPGKGHVADIVFDYLSKDNPRNQSYRACLNGMLALEHAGINSEYVLDQLSTLQRTSALRHATLRAAELLESREHLAIEDVERVYHDVLKAKPASNEDLALDCADIRGLANYLDQRQEQEFITGIPELDRCGTIPARGKLMIVLAYTGVGKSWCLVHLAKKAAVRCRKVLYVTLELPKHEVQRRIYQSFGHAPINEFGLTTTETELQLEDERLIGFEAEERTAECHLGNPRKTNLKVLAYILPKAGNM
jgi:replicative DNA helicase